MKVQSIQNCTFGKTQNSENKGKKIYRYATGAVLTAGICSLASDRLFKSPKKLPTALSKFGFWASWAGLGMIAANIGKALYDKAMASKPEG